MSSYSKDGGVNHWKLSDKLLSVRRQKGKFGEWVILEIQRGLSHETHVSLLAPNCRGISGYVVLSSGDVHDIGDTDDRVTGVSD